MKNAILRFAANDDGAVTVEWVVLTAAVIGLVIVAYANINSASTTLASNTDTTLTTMTVGAPIIGD